VEANGLTFYVFEAQGRRELDLATVDHFNLPDELQGRAGGFLLGDRCGRVRFRLFWTGKGKMFR